MTFFTALGSIAAIITAIWGAIQKFSPTPQQKKENIDKSVDQAEQKAIETGRP